MKKVIIVFIAISLGFALLGFAIDWRSYIANFSTIPNPFDDIKQMIDKLTMKASEFPKYDVHDAFDFFNYVGEFFSFIGDFIGNIFVLVVFIPYKVVSFLFQFIVCVLGFNSIKSLEVLTL